MTHKLIIALDDLDKFEAKEIVEKISKENPENINRIIFKVHDLVAMVWFEWIKDIFSNTKARIMIDNKYHDIPYTVSNYLVQLKKSWLWEKVEIVTVHASAWYECLKKLVETKNELWLNNLKIAAITYLTSLDSNDSFDIFLKNPKEVVLNLSKIAISAWIDTLVCSANETPIIKNVFLDKLLVINPWIRFDDDESQDQKRVVNPETAISRWADYLVMWRSLLKSKDISKSINRALSEMDKSIYEKKESFEFEKALYSWSWQELLSNIWVMYKRKEWWKYCRFTSWLISNIYFNIWVFERYPSVLNRIALELRQKLIKSWLFDENKIEDYVVLWAQMWSIRLSAILSQALWINWTSIYTEKTWESSYWMWLKRHKIDLKWKKVILSEDIISLWSTIWSMISIVKESWWEVVAVTCVWNRSKKENFNWVPIKYCFLPPEFELYWDEKTPEIAKWNNPKLPENSIISEKPKNDWNELISSIR